MSRPGVFGGSFFQQQDFDRSPMPRRADDVIPTGSPNLRAQENDEFAEMRAAYEEEMTALEDENMTLRRQLREVRDELDLLRRSSDKRAIVEMQRERINQLTDEFEKMGGTVAKTEKKLDQALAKSERLKEELSESSHSQEKSLERTTFERCAQTPQPKFFGKRPPPRNHPALRQSVVFRDEADEEERREEDQSVSQMSAAELVNLIKALEEQKAVLERKINKVIPKVHNIETLQIKLQRESNERQYDSVCRMLAKTRLQLARERAEFP